MSGSKLPPGPPKDEDVRPFRPDPLLRAYLEEPQGQARRDFEKLSPIRKFFRRYFGF